MKKIIFLCILLSLILLLTGCFEKNQSAMPIDTGVQPVFNYIVVKEAGDFYLHKLGPDWSSLGGIVIFTCPVCGNTIRVPEEDIIMYENVTINTAWGDYVDVCSGDASDWHDLLDD